MAANMTILSLQGQGLKLNTRADVEPHLAGRDPSIIEEVHFGGNTIGVDASKAIAEFLLQAKRLKIADFADVFTGRLITEIPEALSAICDALKDHTELVELNLSDNAFGGRSVEPMVPFLTQNRSLQIFKLNNNGLGPQGGEVIANALLKSAQTRKENEGAAKLRTVICGRNRLENGSAPAWAEAFAAHGTLVEVRMPQNGIRMDGITALARGLAKCPELQHLDLQDNTFTEDDAETGVEAWAGVVPSWPELRVLNLSDCVLSHNGEVPKLVSVLAEGSNPNLQNLQLQNNNLEAQTFALLAEAVSAGLKSVKRLELQWNEADEDDDSLGTLRSALQARGGKLFVTDEDEEQDEEEAEAAEEAEEAEEAQAPTPPPPAEKDKMEHPLKPPKTAPAPAAPEKKVDKDKDLPDTPVTDAPLPQVPPKEPAPAPQATEQPGILDRASDALADLMSKVKLGGS